MLSSLTSVLSLFLSTSFLLVGGGLLVVLLPIRGQLDGFTTSQIGFMGTGWAIGFTLGCILVPKLVRRVGHVRTFGALAASLGSIVLLNGLYVEAWAWILLRAMSGFCFAGAYMIIESWINESITDDQRGAMFSVYMIISQLAFLGGQYSIVVGDVSTDKLFMMGAILFCLSVLPIALSGARSPAPLTQADIDLKGMFLNSPAAFVGSLVAGVLSSSFQSFGPVFGNNTGMSTASIANMMAFVMLGAIVFQYPLGRLSDITDRRYVMVGLSILGAGAGFLISIYQVDGSAPQLTFYLLMIILGGLVYPIYGLVNAHANDHADPEDFVKISSSLLILYGIGNMIGPSVTGPAMQWLGNNALFQIIGLAHLVLAVHMTYRITRRQAPVDDVMDYQVIPMATPAISTETYALDPRSDSETYMADSEEDDAHEHLEN